MIEKLPSLVAIRSFEAAGRHLNFSRAASELFVTHGAVSHQIKSLEEDLGVKLFQRFGREMALTDAGQRLHSHTREAFTRLRRGVSEVRNSTRRQSLIVSVLPAFGARWLVPRLPRFQLRHPDIDPVFHATIALADFGREEVDVAIRYGLGEWPGVKSEFLLDEEVFPVCSPNFRGGRLPRTAHDLLTCPLLHDLYQPWSEWFRSVGVTPPDGILGMGFSESNLLLKAALDGQGIALALATHVHAELESGDLIKLHFRRRTRFAYYFVSRRADTPLPKVAAFRNWLLEEVADHQRGR